MINGSGARGWLAGPPPARPRPPPQAAVVPTPLWLSPDAAQHDGPHPSPREAVTKRWGGTRAQRAGWGDRVAAYERASPPPPDPSPPLATLAGGGERARRVARHRARARQQMCEHDSRLRGE